MIVFASPSCFNMIQNLFSCFKNIRKGIVKRTVFFFYRFLKIYGFPPGLDFMDRLIQVPFQIQDVHGSLIDFLVEPEQFTLTLQKSEGSIFIIFV